MLHLFIQISSSYQTDHSHPWRVGTSHSLLQSLPVKRSVESLQYVLIHSLASVSRSRHAEYQGRRGPDMIRIVLPARLLPLLHPWSCIMVGPCNITSSFVASVSRSRHAEYRGRRGPDMVRFFLPARHLPLHLPSAVVCDDGPWITTVLAFVEFARCSGGRVFFSSVAC